MILRQNPEHVLFYNLFMKVFVQNIEFRLTDLFLYLFQHVKLY